MFAARFQDQISDPKTVSLSSRRGVVFALFLICNCSGCSSMCLESGAGFGYGKRYRVWCHVLAHLFQNLHVNLYALSLRSFLHSQFHANHLAPHSQASASWQLWNYCITQIPAEKKALRINMDETSICLFQGGARGNAFLSKDEPRPTEMLHTFR